MKALYSLLFIALFSSCDASSKQESGENAISEELPDDKFIGVWRYYTSSYESKDRRDHSMDDIMGRLKILDGTKETYSFSFLQFNLLFSKANDSTLAGIDSKFILEYHRSNSHLKLNIGDGSFNEFTKLK